MLTLLWLKGLLAHRRRVPFAGSGSADTIVTRGPTFATLRTAELMTPQLPDASCPRT